MGLKRGKILREKKEKPVTQLFSPLDYLLYIAHEGDKQWTHLNQKITFSK